MSTCWVREPEKPAHGGPDDGRRYGEDSTSSVHLSQESVCRYCQKSRWREEKPIIQCAFSR